MSKHTPGPWSVSNGTLIRVTDTKSRPVVICGVHRIGKNGGRFNGGDPLANAHLIAAAPDQNAALVSAPRPSADGKNDGWIIQYMDWYFKTRADALAKAEGK